MIVTFLMKKEVPALPGIKCLEMEVKQKKIIMMSFTGSLRHCHSVCWCDSDFDVALMIILSFPCCHQTKKRCDNPTLKVMHTLTQMNRRGVDEYSLEHEGGQ